MVIAVRARLRTLAPDSFARLRTVTLLVLVVFLFKGPVCCTRLRTVTHGYAHRGRTATHACNHNLCTAAHAWTSLDRTAITTGLDGIHQKEDQCGELPDST